MSAPCVFTIRAGVPFADALVAGLRHRLGDAPEALADVRLFLPTRRACRTMALAFLRHGQGRPVLLPRMTPLGDIDEDDVAFDETEPATGGGAADIPPSIAPVRRQLLLTRRLATLPGFGARPAQAALLATELARLFDQVHAERLDLAGLDRLVPDELARHWQVTLDFLKPLAAWWQQTLQAEGCIDPADRRNRLLAAQATAFRAAPPATPVIAAGSTGSMPATADLMAVIAGLPAGVVVLPGLDLDSDDTVWRAIALDPDHPDLPLAQAHPQYGLAHLLRRLGIERRQVQVWPSPGVVAVAPARATLLARALAPASCTAPLGVDPGDSFADVTRIDATTPEEEARTIALILRQALEQPERTAALVTPDRTLARRVAAELERWDIAVDDSGGEPLSQTPPAAFLRLLARAVKHELAPVPLLAVLSHPLAAGGMAPAAFRSWVRHLEHLVLRGLRPPPGIEGLRLALREKENSQPQQATPEQRSAVAAALGLVRRLEAVLEPMLHLAEQPSVSLAATIEAHVTAAESLAVTDVESGSARLWSGDAGEMLASFISDLAEAGRHDLQISLADYPELLDVLMQGRAVRPRWGRHPRLAIWGPLEARLQQADVMVLGGLNEETWPPRAKASPWMSRPMMQDFGLPLPERRTGLSAHDFCQAVAAPEVWLTRSRRAEGAPTVPCRWLLRLDAVLHGTGWQQDNEHRAARLLAWQRMLDAPADGIAAQPRPQPPAPPLEARPRRLSVTQIETWMRDPYALYARHILKLEPLDLLDAEPEASDFGTSLHAALARFVAERPPADETIEEGVQRLLGYGRDALGDLLQRPAVRAFWWPRFERIALWFAATERERRPDVAASATEVLGSLTFGAPGGPFELCAKADRIDRLADGTLMILDYKTGTPPKGTEVEAGIAPQLPLEAVIAERGGFPGDARGPVSALEFWHLKGDEAGGERKSAAKDVGGVTARALEGLISLVSAFDDPQTPYEPQPRPQAALRWNDYEHLARIREWASGSEDPE